MQIMRGNPICGKHLLQLLVKVQYGWLHVVLWVREDLDLINILLSVVTTVIKYIDYPRYRVGVRVMA